MDKKQETQKYYIYKPHPPSKVSLKVNTSRSRGQLKLLKQIIKDNPKWLQVFKNGDVLWSGLAMGIQDISIAADIRINRFPEMKHICHKKITGYILNKFSQYWPDQYWFYPKTYLIPQQTQSLEKQLKQNTNKMFIAKPSSGSQGDGIAIIRSIKDIPITIYNQQFVVQPYIDKPLLLDGKKFDLRLYVLVTSLDPYLCYLNEQGLARLCTEDYQPPTKQNLKNPFIHFTNYSLNKNHESFIATQSAFGKGSKRCFKVLWQQLSSQGVNVDQLREKIDEVARKFMVGLYPFMKYYYNSTFPKSQGKCFHIIGLDILIDNELNPWILQANSNPSLNIEHEVYKATGQTISQISEIDKYVKRMVVQDAIFLSKKSIQSQKQIEEGELYYSYKNIINQQNLQLSQMNIFSNMLKIFHYLGGIKTKSTITASQFIKLSKFAGMTDSNVTRNDYHLIFVKIMRNRLNTHSMDFQAMIQALEYIINKITPFTEENKYQIISNQIQSITDQIE